MKIRAISNSNRGQKSGLKMVQVKGVMPPGGGITRETAHKGRQCQPSQSRLGIWSMA